MNPTRDIALIDQLRAEPVETPWLEFKRNNTDPEMIGKRCSALANSARIEGQDLAYMVDPEIFTSSGERPLSVQAIMSSWGNAAG